MSVVYHVIYVEHHENKPPYQGRQLICVEKTIEKALAWAAKLEQSTKKSPYIVEPFEFEEATT